MKKIILLVTILASTISYTQNNIFGNIPVEGIKEIKRNDILVNKTINSNSFNLKQASKGAPTGSSQEVGITEGDLEVSLSGSATYSIPIAVPPGVNEIVPKISITYNSQGGNGLAGYGWNISGVSVITRIPSTKYHDGKVDVIDFDNLDRFSFDGQRLIVKNGTNGNYGGDNTVYETENFSNIKITSVGQHPLGANYGPSFFLVQYPDGSIAHYGASTDSRSITDWAITYWQNAQGVKINYTYNNLNNNLSLNTISYGNTYTNTPINEIKFIYKSRQRSEQAYVTGLSFIRNTILSEIQVKGNNVGFRNYILEHDVNSLGYERLISITEKNGDKSKSLNPTVFKYDTTSNTNLFNISNPINLNVSNLDYTNTSSISGDFDGDGKTDMILYPTTGTSAYNKYWLFKDITGTSTNIGYEHILGNFKAIMPISWLSWNNKLMPMQGWCAVQHDAVTNITTFRSYSSGTVNPVYYQYDKSYVFPKFQYSYWQEPCANRVIEDPSKNNSETDKLPPIDPNEPVWVEITKDIPKHYLNGDFNGDGLSDVIIIEGFVNYSITTGCITYSQTYNGGKSYFLNLDRRITSNYLSLSGNLPISALSKFIVCDVNGDGKSDLMIYDNGIVKIFTLNDNNILIELFSKSDPNILLDKPLLMGDYNGDGKSDFVIPQADNTDAWCFFISSGINFEKTCTSIGLNYTSSKIGRYGINGWPILTYSLAEVSYIPTDFNGDGKTDILSQVNYTVERIADDYTENGAPQITKLYLLENKGYNGTSMNFTLAITNAQFGGIKRYPIPIITDHNNLNRNLEYSLISNNFIKTFKSTKDNKKDVRLKEITLGNGVKDVITYASLTQEDPNTYFDNIYTPSTYTEDFPNFDIHVSPSFYVVSQLERVSDKDYKKQLFKYYGAVSNTEGLGFIAFRGLSRTNWFNDDFAVISSVTKHDITKRGATSETYTVSGILAGEIGSYSPTSFINKSSINYSTSLLPNKVFDLKNISTINYNGLDNTSKEITATYDDYNNPLTTTIVTKNGSVIEQTETTNLDYFNQPVGSLYYIGRPKSKIKSIFYGGETMTSEELFFYNSQHLLSQIKKKGHLTNYITENNFYDIFGNIIKKEISATGLPTRVTEYTFDSSGRFMLSSKNIEGQQTTFNYNNSNGLLITEVAPSNLGYPLSNTFEYDTWGKKKVATNYLGKKTYTNYENASNGYSRIINTGDDGSYSLSEYDDLGRLVKNTTKNIDGNLSTVDTHYDIYNRKIRVSDPYLSMNGGTAALYTTTSFDLYGRPIQILEPTGKTTSINYSGLTTTLNDGIKNVITTKNAVGNIVSNTDNGGTISYTYFPNGNLKETIFEGTTITIEQDGWGRKTKLTDPSAGIYQYEYNDFGETTKEITLKGETIYTLDDFGKVTEKTIVGIGGDPTHSRTIYNYDITTKLLNSSTYDDLTDGEQHIEYYYTYDNFKRLIKSVEAIERKATFERETTYDEFGRPLKEFYGATNLVDSKVSNKWIKNTYKNGVPWQIIDDVTSQVLWQTNEVNERGQLSKGFFGNGINISNTYDQFGFPTQYKHDFFDDSVIVGGEIGGDFVDIMTINNSFNPITGNLNTRSNSLFNTNEIFKYDNLDRLIEWTTVPREIHNLKFTTTAEGFVNFGSASVAWSTDRLKISTSSTDAGAQKLIFDNAFQGDKFKVQMTADDLAPGTAPYRIRTSIIEEDQSGNIQAYPIGTVNDGHFEAEHIIQNNNVKVYVRFDKVENAPFIIALRKFTIDDVIISKISGIEKQYYDNKGKIASNNIGNYNYTIPGKLYQNSSIYTNTESNSYYARQELQNISYNAFKSPIQISELGSDKINFLYNASNNRSAMYYGSIDDDKMIRPYRKYYSSDGSMEITYDINTNQSNFVTYVGGDAYSAPLFIKSDGTTQEYLYLHRDYQGTIVAITNGLAQVVEKRLFDVWGDISLVQDGANNNLGKLSVLDRGYTGHEHLQSVGLIHMNGRLYDPKIHRFLQPDNFVQDPYNTQSFNRYGYVWNNPTKFVDQSGEFFWMAVVVGAVVGAVSGAVGYLASAISTGNWNWGQFGISILTGAVIGGISGAIAQQACTITMSAIVDAAASSFFAGFMPSTPIPIDSHWSFNVSPAIAFGNASGIGVNLSLGYSDGNWNFAYGVGVMNYGNYNGFGKNSFEVRNSILAAWDDGKMGLSLGTNFWGGDFKQRTGMIGLHSGDFRAMYENDGSILGLGDGGDSYRSAALNLTYKDFSAGFNLFTGYRDYENECGSVADHRDVPVRDKFNRKMPNGYAKEEGTKYRLGALTVGYKGYKVGVNSEHVRHAIQDQAIHNLRIPWFKGKSIFDKRQMGFENQSWNWNGYSQYKSSNGFTSW